MISYNSRSPCICTAVWTAGVGSDWLQRTNFVNRFSWKLTLAIFSNAEKRLHVISMLGLQEKNDTVVLEISQLVLDIHQAKHFSHVTTKVKHVMSVWFKWKGLVSIALTPFFLKPIMTENLNIMILLHDDQISTTQSSFYFVKKWFCWLQYILLAVLKFSICKTTWVPPEVEISNQKVKGHQAAWMLSIYCRRMKVADLNDLLTIVSVCVQILSACASLPVLLVSFLWTVWVWVFARISHYWLGDI